MQALGLLHAALGQFQGGSQAAQGGWSGFLTNGWYGTDMTTPWCTPRRVEGYGLEILELHGGQVIHGEAAFNVWEAGKQAATRYFEPG